MRYADTSPAYAQPALAYGAPLPYPTRVDGVLSRRVFAYLIDLLLYSAVTVGGSSGATIGMRVFGIKVLDASTAGPVGGLLAALHALLFYVAAGTMILLIADVMIALARDDRRMGHDLVAGLVLVRRG